MTPKKNKPATSEDDKDFPGYPHYPANEDIMNSKDKQRVDVDMENIARSNKISPLNTVGKPAEELPAEELRPAIGDTEDEVRIVSGTEADLTKEDLIILGIAYRWSQLFGG